ncbi:hypothetical protein [Demequina muriae]|uniref:Uncharacterized protein n=1 Tax=Demequina muriae TaxID=3051664 RepID=A0ABT8GE59_9MICO|nr:hypothetical protein [Demequina sp. EGI L300058]MDN4479649.1 hypothetical protein [Demequina sp. EGI L300058]
MPESKLHEYKAETEQLRSDLDSQIPAELIDSEPTIEAEAREGAEHGPGGEPSSSAWWQVRQYRWLDDSAGSSERAAQAIHDHLVGEGWSYSRERESADGPGVSDGYRRTDDDDGGWYVELTWAETTPDRAESLVLLIVSPMTVLGSDQPKSERTGPVD